MTVRIDVVSDPRAPVRVEALYVGAAGTGAEMFAYNADTSLCAVSLLLDGDTLDKLAAAFTRLADEVNGRPRSVERVAVGMGATLQVGSDSYPYTVVAVSKSGKAFDVQGDDHKLVSGSTQSESQEYAYSRSTTAAVKTVKWTSKGWRMGGLPVWLGSRRYYRDPSY